MKRSERLEPIVEMAATREQEARKRLGEAQARRRELAEKIDALKRYRSDYSHRLEAIGGGGLNAKQFSDYRTFLAKINRAVDEQELLLEKVDRELQDKERVWGAARSYVKSLQKVHAASLTEELNTTQRREQREADDRAGRRGEGGLDIEMAST